MSKQNTVFKKRALKIKNFLKNNHLKINAVVEVSGKSRITVSHILNGLRYPKFTEEVLTRIENHFSIN